MLRRLGVWAPTLCGGWNIPARLAPMRTIANTTILYNAPTKLKVECRVNKIVKPAKDKVNSINKRSYTRKVKNNDHSSSSSSDRKSNKKATRSDKSKDNETKSHARSNVKAASTTSLLNTIMKEGLKIEGDEDLTKVSARPAYMFVEREEEVLKKAERMQIRDLTGEVPVPAFTFEILKAHPSLLNMGLRERMDFLLIRWSALSNKKRLEYLNDPLRGLI